MFGPATFHQRAATKQFLPLDEAIIRSGEERLKPMLDTISPDNRRSGEKRSTKRK
jgi:hypothetical protein